MFTGIVEATGKVIALEKDRTNLDICIESTIAEELSIDQSVSHNGVCLSVTKQESNFYWVTAVEETLAKSNIGLLKEGDIINLERSMRLGDRLDGHMVQGHVDIQAECLSVFDKEGSWFFTFKYKLPDEKQYFTVEKGSVCVNGISLTVVDSQDNQFSVAIIPYTYEHTNLKYVQPGDKVNLEFDILGKYIEKLMQNHTKGV